MEHLLNWRFPRLHCDGASAVLLMWNQVVIGRKKGNGKEGAPSGWHCRLVVIPFPQSVVIPFSVDVDV